ILDLYPVVLQDNRILDLERNSADPWRLNFPGATPEMEFLKLDEKEDKEATSRLPGWAEFFNGDDPNAKEGPPVRGFYSYYPVEKAKEGAIVAATFTAPRARLLSGQEQPYLVLDLFSRKGRTVWLGSAEMWRLRQYREA